ncbi:adenylate/guanylate cyclase domain-containing protein [Methylobacterium sp. NEAU K]|uniref:adenylate/guanylate cyclase domain-containing protein n=1 Tax=Methylobacterium sp. NEAU K TaxID=3064946 RepID=UPI00273505DA|nr:adenylate/guanylate cyclase domain-containing protein [Methylobacterium sp. NEAU K]MDP4004936.1 adenylate/guanylate cyclase domain-containing protein [Methylobacterium sp. NEAU K]
MRFSPRWFYLVAPGLGALAGLLYGSIFAVGPLTGSAIRGAIIGAPILLYERRLLLPAMRERVRQLATPLFLIATVAIYVGMIIAGNAAASTVLNRLFRFMYSERNAMLMSQSGLLYALGASAVAVFVFRVRDLIGPGVFANLLIGRYHRPISEERVFLFLDVTGSTRFADRHGDRAAQAYLGQVFNALALPVSRARGSIDDYIGDMALVTWTIERGTRDAACLRCVFDFAARLAEDAAAWTERFGQVPEFRAALHCGSVVTAEIGLERHKIAYFGDVVNTTARLESLSKTLGVHVLVSADLLDRIGRLPDDLVAEGLGRHSLRGRDEPLAVAAITQRAAAPMPTSTILSRAAQPPGLR